MFDLQGFLSGSGVIVTLLIVGGIVFAESGLLLGFFLPGDTLLLSAGILAAQGKLPLVLTIIIVAITAIAGDNVGYGIGQKLGPRLFNKKDGVLFRQEYVERARSFFERYGIKTMLFAHFIPVVRSFAPIVAGVGNMDRRKFILYDAIGDTAWAILVTLIGYWFGSKIPNIDHYILLAIVGVMVLTFGPVLYHLGRNFWQAHQRKSAKPAEKD